MKRLAIISLLLWCMQGGKKKNKKKNNDFTYDVCGWIILAFGIVAWVGMAKSLGPPPPAR